MHTVTIITQSRNMMAVLGQLRDAAASDATVLLVGETGVGKELLAQYVHGSSPRCKGRLVKISLSAVPADLTENELFGHEKGAFTGAEKCHHGLFQQADRGTLFLDDIDDTPLVIQAKLLRALESHRVNPLGTTREIPVDVRVVAASKVELSSLVERGLFRKDLFYRLNVIPISIPPLRERPEDIPILMDHFLGALVLQKSFTFSGAAIERLSTYSWPGNVRELRNVTERLALLAPKEIRVQDLPSEIQRARTVEPIVQRCVCCYVNKSVRYRDVMSCVEANLLRQALEDAQGNKTKAARALGLSLTTFWDKLRKHALFVF